MHGLAQHDRALLVESDQVEGVLADVNADRVDESGTRSIGVARHGMLLLFAAPHQFGDWAGREHGWSIPLA